MLIGGTLRAPRISLESDAQPPLSQSDLLSYLAFGERSSTLLQFNQTSLSATQGGNLLNVAGSRLAGIALGVALDEVKGSAARSLGVDVFNITPGDIPVFNNSNGDFLRATEIEVGRYATPSTFVSLVGSLAGTPGASDHAAHREGPAVRRELQSALHPRSADARRPDLLADRTASARSSFASGGSRRTCGAKWTPSSSR